MSILMLVPMESFFTKINTLAGSTLSTAQIVAIAFAVIMFFVLSARSNFKTSSMIISFVVCSFFVWAVFNMNWGKTTMGETINTNPAPAANGQP